MPWNVFILVDAFDADKSKHLRTDALFSVLFLQSNCCIGYSKNEFADSNWNASNACASEA